MSRPLASVWNMVCAIVCAVVLLAAGAGQAAGGMQQVRQLLESGAPGEARELATRLAASGNRLAQHTLAGMLLRGVGGAEDRHAAMGWLCLRAHDPAGGKPVTQAAWLLAEYFRTGGGLPGQRYNDGSIADEDPVRAQFWFGVLASQETFFDATVSSAARLGRIGLGSNGRMLLEGELQLVTRRLESWDPALAPATPEDCLKLPRI